MLCFGNPHRTLLIAYAIRRQCGREHRRCAEDERTGGENRRHGLLLAVVDLVKDDVAWKVCCP